MVDTWNYTEDGMEKSYSYGGERDARGQYQYLPDENGAYVKKADYDILEARLAAAEFAIERWKIEEAAMEKIEARLAEAERLLRWGLLNAKPGKSEEIMAFLRAADNGPAGKECWCGLEWEPNCPAHRTEAESFGRYRDAGRDQSWPGATVSGSATAPRGAHDVGGGHEDASVAGSTAKAEIPRTPDSGTEP